MGQLGIRVEGLHNPSLAQRLKTNLGRTSDKNPSDRLIRLAWELAKLITKTNSKMHKSKTYNKAINNPINRNKWQEFIDEEL